MARDTGDLKRALQAHSVNGYRVHVPMFGTGTIQGDGVRVRDMISYRVKPDNPIPFEQLAKNLGFDTYQYNLEEWIKRLRAQGRENPLTMIPPEIEENLQAGGKASWRDIQEVWLLRYGCIDEKQNVVCYDFTSEHVQIDPSDLQQGMLVEFHDAKMGGNWGGRVVGLQGEGENKIVLLEVFEPVPFMDAPEAIEPREIRPGFFSGVTWKIGYGTYEGLSKAKSVIEDFADWMKMDVPESLDQLRTKSGEKILGKYSTKLSKSGLRQKSIQTVLSTLRAAGSYSPELLQFVLTPPDGKPVEDKEGERQVPHFALKDPIPLSLIQEFCEKTYSEFPHCYWQSLILYIIPVHPEPVPGDHKGGIFYPLPPGSAEEIEVWGLESYEG